MRRARSERTRLALSAVTMVLMLIVGVASTADVSAAVDPEAPFTISIENASAKVGETAVIVATITTRRGFYITDSYQNRIRKLSASDGVELPSAVVFGSVQDGALIFRVGVRLKKAGTHTVTGLFRFSFHDDHQLEIKSALFEATVTATD